MGVVGMEGPECYSGTDLLLVELLRRSDACPAGALLNDTTGFAEISHFSSSSPSSLSFSFYCDSADLPSDDARSETD